MLRDLGMSPGAQMYGEKVWLKVAGNVKPRRDVSQQNRFTPLQNEGLTDAVDECDEPNGQPCRSGCSRLEARGPPRAKKVAHAKTAIVGKIGCHAGSGCCGVREAAADLADESGPKPRSVTSLATFIEKRPQHLKPLCQNGDWETIEAILDSGASVIVIPPHFGRGYEIQPGEASKAGVRYEVANGEEIPNLGEKNLLVMTEEGTWRGLKAQVAEVTKALQSVRGLVKAGHLVVFGDGEDGCQHYILNKITGEVNNVADDGINYLMRMHVVPPTESPFGGPVAAS